MHAYINNKAMINQPSGYHGFSVIAVGHQSHLNGHMGLSALVHRCKAPDACAWSITMTHSLAFNTPKRAPMTTWRTVWYPKYTLAQQVSMVAVTNMDSSNRYMGDAISEEVNSLFGGGECLWWTRAYLLVKIKIAIVQLNVMNWECELGMPCSWQFPNAVQDASGLGCLMSSLSTLDTTAWK